MNETEQDKLSATLDEKDNFGVRLGEIVRKVRTEQNLTQNAVAKALNVSPGYISNVENGRTSMSLKVLIVYSRLTSTSLDTLVGLAEDEQPMTLIDHDILRIVSRLPLDTKKKILNTLQLWFQLP